MQLRVLFLNWRDTRNPEGGGSEVYVESVARALAAAGHDVTVFCAAYPGAAADEVRDGVRFVREGTKLSVYRRARHALRSGRLGTPDVVVDVQNGIPFLAPWATRAPVVVLVHHVHREQWPVVYDPVRARVGWFVESRLAPAVNRRCRYVAVSEATRAELAALGVDAEAISVVHNGAEVDLAPARPDPEPRVLVLGRLVPHKRVEHVLDAAAALRHRYPGLRVAVVGDGWWSDRLRAHAAAAGVDDLVEFTGFVDEARKVDELARAWVLALPSLKEGWGLVVTEAAARGVPALAYADAGGVNESVVDGETGLLVPGGPEQFTAALDLLLSDAELRGRLGAQARARAAAYSWDDTAARFADVLALALADGHDGRPRLARRVPVGRARPARVRHAGGGAGGAGVPTGDGLVTGPGVPTGDGTGTGAGVPPAAGWSGAGAADSGEPAPSVSSGTGSGA